MFMAHKRQEQHRQQELCGGKGARRRGARNKIPNCNPLSGDQVHSTPDARAKETKRNGKYVEEIGHGESPSLENLVQERLVQEMLVQERTVQERFVQEKLVQQSLESNVTEMTKTWGYMMGISQYHKREKNMTKLGNMVWSERQCEVKSTRSQETCFRCRLLSCVILLQENLKR